LLFTDGVTEARDTAGEEFGEHRLEQCLRSYRGRNAAELRSLILNEVTEFCSDHFDDDATLLGVIAD
jgi:sigma-B regulation protein RsbU (phosphoserine phosphatase)